MFNDRDLGILGAGGLLAVLCLLLPWSFTTKVVVALITLVVFMVVALLRVGPDRVPLEVFLKRRIKFFFSVRRYSYHGREADQIHHQAPAAPVAAPALRPVSLAWEEVGVYVLLTVWLAVIGVFFVVWLANGGSEQIGDWFRRLS